MPWVGGCCGARFGAGWGLGCSEEELVKGSWTRIPASHKTTLFLAVAGRASQCTMGMPTATQDRAPG